MGVFGSSEELQDELVAFLTRFLGSDDWARARPAAQALGDRARLVVRTLDPEAVVAADFFAGTVSLRELPEANVEVELEADALHDILLGRLDPVGISRLWENDEMTFRGTSTELAALVLLAGPLQPHYPASLLERGRQDLLDTPAPATSAVWSSDGPPKELIGARRPWQRPKRAVARS